MRKLTTEHVRQVCLDKGFKLLGEYTGNHYPVKVECKNGHVTEKEYACKEHRKVLKDQSKNLYRWLKENNYPKDNFRLLCYNCNCARRQGKCPHEEE